MIDYAANTDREAAIAWARSILAQPSFRIVDTETTGLGPTDEIISMGIVDNQGHVLFDSLIKPSIPIPAEASAIHGRYDADVASAPSFAQVYEQIARLLQDQVVVIYNLDYDSKRIRYCCQKDGLPAIGPRTGHCAMKYYASYHGEWNHYWGNYSWQKLTVACQRHGIRVQHAHSAVGDCLMTLELIRHMAHN